MQLIASCNLKSAAAGCRLQVAGEGRSGSSRSETSVPCDLLCSVSVPESWGAFSNANVQRSQAERAASRQLRDELDALLARTHDEIWRHWNTVNVAFTQRIAEQQDAKFKTETHLQKARGAKSGSCLLLSVVSRSNWCIKIMIMIVRCACRCCRRSTTWSRTSRC